MYRFPARTVPAVVLLGILGTGAIAGRRPVLSDGRGVGPDEVETVAPCCRVGTTPAQARRAPVEGAAERGQELPWERNGIDPVIWERLKEAALTDPRAPLADELAEQLPQSRVPAIASAFEGLTQGEVGFSAAPPDTILAVGPEHVLQAVNLAVRLTDRQGGAVVDQRLQDHFGLPATGGSTDPLVTDPKVFYDAMSRRFFLLMVAVDFDRQSFARVYLSVSRTPTPATLGGQDWCNYAIDSRLGDTWSDYPGLGMNERWLAISTNNFPFQGFSVQARLFVADKTKLVDNAASCPSVKFFKFNLRQNDLTEFNPQPAQHYEPTGLPGEPLYAVSTDIRGASRYKLYRIQGKKKKPGGRPKLFRVWVDAMESYVIPPTATQTGTGERVDTGDPRVMQQIVYRHGRLWFAHATGCRVKGVSHNQSCVRVVRVDVGDKSAAVDFEQTLGKKREHYFWPGVVVTPGGAVVAAFQRSGDERTLGVAYTGMRDGSAVRLAKRKGFDKVKVAVPGECTLQNAQLLTLPTGEQAIRVRSGDYVGIAPDPESEEVWFAGEYGKSAFGGFSCVWGTRVLRVRY